MTGTRLTLVVLLTAAVISSVGCAATATAGEVSGDGTLLLNNEQSRIVGATVRFLSDDHFICELQLAGGSTIDFKGVLHGEGRHRQITIKHGFAQGDAEIEGHGEMTVADRDNPEGGRLVRISARGELFDRKNTQFSIKFEASKDQQPRGVRHSFADHVDGRGRLDIGTDKFRVTYVTVRMTADGEFELHVEGPDMPDRVYSGRWRGDGPKYDVELMRAGSHRLRTKGSLTLSDSRRAFKALEIDGEEEGEYFRIYFEAR